MKTPTKTLIQSMRILAQTIHTTDGLANAAIAEAADRLEELADVPIWYSSDLEEVILDCAWAYRIEGEPKTIGDLIDLRNAEREEER
jgi:hypothetical protein